MNDINELLRRHELDRLNDIKNDEENEHNAMIVELEDYHAVVTVPAYFNYLQRPTIMIVGPGDTSLQFHMSSHR